MFCMLIMHALSAILNDCDCTCDGDSVFGSGFVFDIFAAAVVLFAFVVVAELP